MVLLVYETVPERTDFYLIPNDANISESVRAALGRMNGLMIGADDMTEEQDRLATALSDALHSDASHCHDPSLAGQLLAFRVDLKDYKPTLIHQVVHTGIVL